MQLSLRYRTDDQFWFTFFHEAGHILLHDKRDVFLEGIAGLSGESKTKEEEADRFAADFLIPPQYTRSLQEIHTKAQAKKLAEQLGISPGIVVGRIQHDGYITPALANYWELKRQFQWKKHLDTEE
jgi:Zn-dependent peptidase ImmA (M78 family)